MIVQCPHCLDYVFIESINCGIFRHAVFKHNLEPIPPHSSFEECIRLQHLTFGCGKPFKIQQNNQGFIITKCDYI
jgi:hypothetical protein